MKREGRWPRGGRSNKGAKTGRKEQRRRGQQMTAWHRGASLQSNNHGMMPGAGPVCRTSSSVSPPILDTLPLKP